MNITPVYPGKQEEYLAMREGSVRAVRELIAATPRPSVDFLMTCVKRAAEDRLNYALQVQDEDAEAFGAMRLSHRDDGRFEIAPSWTPLCGAKYQEYGTRTVTRIVRLVINLLSQNVAPLHTAQTLAEDTYEGIKSRLEFRLIFPETMKEIDEKGRVSSGGRIVLSPEYKKNYPQDYVNEVIFRAAKDTGLSQKCEYVIATSRLQMMDQDGKEKMFAMSTHVFQKTSDGKYTLPTIVHHDPYLLPTTIVKIAAIFNEAVILSKTPGQESELRKKVGLLRYLFAHAMPMERGSAHCGGVLERALLPASSKPILDQRDAAMQVDLEAMTAPTLNAFMETYLGASR